MDGGTWWAAVHGVAESRTRLSDFTFTFHFHALEKEMATPSSVCAWRIPGTGEPGGLPSMGSHRVGHDWSDLAAAAAATILHIRSTELIHFTDGYRFPLTNISWILPQPSPWRWPLCTLSLTSVFFDSTYEWEHTIFVFLPLTYFTLHNTLTIHLCCCLNAISNVI